MKYYKGETLDKYLEKYSQITFNEFLEQVFFPLLNAVSIVHKNGYIHRDIKLNNIIIYRDKPVLIDFGSAVKYKGNYQTGIVLTPGFSPIEFYSQKADQGRCSDIYSLTVILYYFFTKTIPEEALNRIIEDNLISVNKLNKDVSDYLNRFIMRNLSLDSNKRDQSIRLFKLKLGKEYLKSKIKKIIVNLSGNYIAESSNK